MEKKYKLLIADDEFWVRKKLVSLLNWDALGIECLEPATDGQEALEKVHAYQPDILLTDINMPFLNGVELLEKIHREKPDLVSFVISGYDDFEYVKGTFLNGGIDYLLKPVSREDLEAAVSKALALISAREDARRKVRKAASLLRDTEFSQLVRDRDTTALPTGSMEQYLGMSNMALMLIKIHNLTAVTRQFDYDMSLYSWSVKENIQRLSQREDLIVFNHIYRPGEFMIIAEMDEAQMAALARRIQDEFTRYPNVRLTVCITGGGYSIDRIHIAYKEAVSQLLSREFVQESRILGPGTAAMTGENSGKLDPEIVKQAQNHLRSGNKQALMRLLLEETGIGNCRGWQYIQVLQLAKEIALVLSRLASKNNPDSAPVDGDALTENLCRAVETLDNQAVREAVKAAAEYLAMGQRELPMDTTRNVIRQAAAYIDENYFEDLNLSVLAERFNMESSYFSRLFRQEMGENLIFYITKKRIEKARVYIANPDINLTEVSFMVGYNDYSYFNRVFKKNTGMSPREYRSYVSTQEG